MQQQLSDIIAGEVQLESGGFAFTEGPAADEMGNIYFVDIGNSRIHYWDIQNHSLSTIREDSGGADGMFVDGEGSLWICEITAKRLSRISPDGAYSVIVGSYNQAPLSGPNDLWFDGEGGLYFTDSYVGHEIRGSVTRLYYFTGNELILLADDYRKSNGLHGSPDGNHLYVADYLDDRIYSYRVASPGVLIDRKLFSSIRCDGMCVDMHGNVYICTGNYNDGVAVVGSDGKTIGYINVPEHAHNITFGGADLSTLYIAASHGLYSLKTNTVAAKNGSPFGSVYAPKLVISRYIVYHSASRDLQ